MNHQPFENWLITDQPLSSLEKHNLDAHIRTCNYCASLLEIGLELHSASMVSPMSGFTDRFGKRLAAQRTADLLRILCVLLVPLLGGVGLLFGLTAPMQVVEPGKVELNKLVVVS